MRRTSPEAGSTPRRAARRSPTSWYEKRTTATITSSSSTPRGPSSAWRFTPDTRPIRESETLGRLFAGTPFDRPPTCDRCGKLESECACPPLVVEPVRLAPETQTARLKLERRPKGKVVTVVGGLDPEGNDLEA